MSAQRLSVTLSAIMLSLAGAACNRTLTAQTTQPNPMATQARQSQRLNIDVKDMELPRTYKLRQSAYFAVVSRERLRFHVTLVHKWKEIADPTAWKVHLVDDRGHVFYPEEKEVRYNDHVTKMWDWEQRTVRRDVEGDRDQELGYIVPNGINQDGWKRPQFLSSVDVFQGSGDYMFRGKDLINIGVKKLTLIMENDGVEYHFVWNLADRAGSGDEPVVKTE